VNRTQIPGKAHSGLAAVVATFNRRALLAECLDALLSQTEPMDEIIVVDNASTDGTADMLSSAYSGRVTHVRNRENLGGAGAFSRGLRLAYGRGHKWFWIMDDDCRPAPSALERLLDVAARNPRALYGPRVLDPKTGAPGWEFRSWKHGIGGLLAIPSIAFNGLFVSRDVVASIGFPLSRLWIYADDVEYSFRARAKGYPAFIVYQSVVYHPTVEIYGWVRIGRRFLFSIPKFRSPDRAYYQVRNTTFIIVRYFNLVTPRLLLGALRTLVCLAFSRTVPLRVLKKALVDGLLFPKSDKDFEATSGAAE
jgi:rhamnopyranosyl-N-acetylglucosaminyl-diphospho-decaprenol beta-1,3/1,4-galactofuranosyltransferase